MDYNGIIFLICWLFLARIPSPLFADSVLLPPENRAGKGVIPSHGFPPLKQSRQPLDE